MKLVKSYRNKVAGNETMSYSENIYECDFCEGTGYIDDMNTLLRYFRKNNNNKFRYVVSFYRDIKKKGKSRCPDCGGKGYFIIFC